ncbi:cytochrome P450 [Aspergillus karnatakaensis]|uniref:cytochrome P450 n=1 Tax=Aspergillus karnatakaensis TaxID=1810916 RepID=UPI003CCE3E73
MISEAFQILSSIPWGWVAVAATAAWLINNYFNKGLNRYPGPALASVTDWWRLYTVWTRKAHFRYLKLHEKHGDVVRLGPNTLSFSNPQVMKAIYGMNKKLGKSDFYPVQMQVSRGEILQSLFGTQDQDYHARLRRAVSNAFSMSSIVQYEPRVTETAKVFLDRTAQLYATTGTRCDLKLWLQFFAFDVITEVTYSRRVGFIDRWEDVDGIIAWLDKIFQYMAPIGQMPILDRFFVKNPVLILLNKYGFIDNSSGTARFSKARMAERLQELEDRKAAGLDAIQNRGDLLTMFLQSQREDKTGFFDDSRILTMTTSIALAGSDTTAISLSAVFYHLFRNPRCLQKLRQEVEDAVKSGLIQDSEILSWADAQKLPYLDACIKETFRIHPAISLNLERVTPPEGLEINGDYIPGGTIVSCMPWVVQRRKEIFGDDVEMYRPERWLLDENTATLEDRARLTEMKATMLHFGGGSRTCLGKHIALLEMYKLVPSFLEKFEINLTTEKEWDLECLWFVKPTEFEVDIKLRG